MKSSLKIYANVVRRLYISNFQEPDEFDEIDRNRVFNHIIIVVQLFMIYSQKSPISLLFSLLEAFIFCLFISQFVFIYTLYPYHFEFTFVFFL